MSLTHLPHPKYRPDIDGLRAIAVLSVVGYHAFPGFIPGGFTGVDVFFVISGYLISTILFEGLKTGRFSFRAFYARRILRIFPALALVLGSCLVVGWFVLLGDEYEQLGKHVAGGAAFVANFVLWGESGYFDNAAETKPLLHLWSLGIEEQFYLIWPLLLWATYRLRLNLLAVAAVVATVSFYLNIESARFDPVADFYAPQTRFWELMLGAVVAGLHQSGSVAVRRLIKHDGLESSLSALGLALIVWGFWAVNKHDIYPSTWALMPVAGSMLIIAAGPGALLNRTVLSHKLLVWIGLISFPLYLWHWPLLSFARILESDVPSVDIRFCALFVSLMFAWLTYRYIEKPIRTARDLSVKAWALLLLMGAVGLSGYYVYSQHGLPFRKAVQLVAAQAGDLSFKSERMTGWRCGELSYEKSRCEYTDEHPKVVVVGDSHAPRIYSGLKAYYANQGKGVAIFGGGGGCPALLNVVVKDNKGKDRNCLRRTTDSLIQIINDPSIETVVFASRDTLYTSSNEFDDPDGTKHGRWVLSLENEVAGVRSNAEVYEIALRQTLDALLKSGKKVAYLYGAPELGFDIKSCIAARPVSLSNHVRNPCAVERPLYDARNQGFKALMRAIVSSREAVHALDLSEALCDEQYCYGAKDGVLFYTDDNHLSHRGAAYIVDRLGDKLLD